MQSREAIVCVASPGSVDCNTGDTLVGWDTDQFLMDERKATLAMKCIVDQGGLAPGGLNFDCKALAPSLSPTKPPTTQPQSLAFPET